jgi:hypothetical protein
LPEIPVFNVLKNFHQIGFYQNAGIEISACLVFVVGLADFIHHRVKNHSPRYTLFKQVYRGL